LKLKDFEADYYELISNLDHPRYILAKFEEEMYLFDKNFEIAIK